MKTTNSFRSKLLALTLALMASVSTFAYEFEYVNDFHVDGFAYKVLPPTMEAPFGNVALIEIADCTEDVVIPGTVTHEGVTYIVTTLGGGATLFTNSAKEIVKSVFIPKKISTINSPLFADCSNLTSIVVDSRNSYYDSRENCNAIITTSQNSFFTPNMLIAGCKTTTIPNSVTEIADKAFYRSAIESITIPTGVTKIGHSAFNQATLLSSIKLPITLTEIGDWAFADCLSLNTISCYALEPPTISSNTFFGSNPIYNNPSVYVPAYCIEAYKNAEHWKWFTQILPINEPAYKDRWCDTWNVLTIKRDLETWQYNLAHDTIIGDYTYTAVTRHTTKVPAGVYPVMAPEPEYVAAVRFTEDKKAFIYYDNTEYLLYDFNAQPGDELTVFAGINHYHSHRTNRCGIGEVNIFPDSDYYYHREISLNVYPNYNHSGPVPTCFGITKWIEGVGDICGLITGADCGLSDDQSALLCAYKDGNTKYTTEDEEYAEYGCKYNSGENKEYILTLPGLQRTEVEFHTDGAGAPSLVSFNEYTPTLVNGKWYLYDGRNYLREENNQVLLYSPEFEIYEDVVLYDWTLEIGDTLPFTIRPFDDDKSRGAVFRVTDVSTITLLDGKEYKKWTLACGIEYIEGIGAINGEGFGNYFCIQHTAHPATYIDTRLVCASKNGQLLYQMDDAEMERLGTECLCDVETSYKSQWCDTWNVFVENGSVYPPHEETYRYQLAKDTVIGDYTYTAVVSKAINDALDAPHYVAAVRFTDDRKVYIYYDNAEYLLYDFNVQEGEELEVFAGINNYTSEIKTYKCTVTGVEQYACVGCPATITLEVHNHPDDFREFYRQTQWIEGVGDINGFLNGINGYINIPGNAAEYLLCAYQGDELKYTGDLYEEYGCGDDAEQSPEDLFPTLWGLQRTEVELSTIEGYVDPYHLSFKEYTPTLVNGKLYLCDGRNYFREENNQVLLYAPYLGMEEDLVLYDWTLEVGDTLPYKPKRYTDEQLGMLFRVTDVSTIQLLDGKEYKKWTFSGGYEFVEGIGAINKGFGHFNCLRHTIHTGMSAGERLVCASRNGQLLIDNTEKWGVECQCEVETSYKSQWCNQWNVMWFDGMRFDETARTSKYRLGKDTVIGDYTYSKFISGTYVRFTDDRKVYVYHEYFDDHDPYSEDLPTGEYLAYDFSAQVGDTLEVFSGIRTYSTYPCIVDEVQTDPETALRTITLHKICRMDTDGDGIEEDYDDGEMTWIEGVGSPNGFLINTPLPGGGSYALLCAYKDDELKYTGSFYERFGCDYNAGVVSEEFFPTLSGLQRTICREYCEQADNKTLMEEYTNLTTRTENNRPYIYCSPFLLREEDNKILIYSRSLNKDLVLYDFNLQVGDSLPMLYIDTEAKDDWIADRDMDIWYVVDYHKDLEGNILPADTLIVTDVSMITLLDGKEYKKWTFNNGMEYVEGIGSFGNAQWSGDFFQLIANKDVPTCLLDEHLVCASKNGQLLYKMDDAEMERLGTTCLCAQLGRGETDNAKEGKIGGRPTPTQWFIVEINQEVIYKLPAQRPDKEESSILSAETFIYTLENDSLRVNGKKYFNLSRYSSKESPDTKVSVGALHFENDNRVWFYHDNAEYLLYDFSAEVGDTLQLFAGIHNYPTDSVYTHVVTAKDTLEDGIARVTLDAILYEHVDGQLNEQHWEKVWLAGLGSTDGIVHNSAKRASNARNNIEQSHVMLCAWRDDECLYTTNHPDFINVGCEYNHDFTAVEDVHTSGTQYKKIIRDGHLYIIHNGGIYNVLGINIAR